MGRTTLVRQGEGGLIAGLVVVMLLLLAGLLWVGMQPAVPATLGTQTISECRSGEDPSTTLCYRPSLPN